MKAFIESLSDLWGQSSSYEKIVSLQFYHSYKVLIRSDFRQNKDIYHKSDLMWPSVTIGVKLNQMKYLRIRYVSIHIQFYQNRFINRFLKERPKGRKTEFFVRCRRTYILNRENSAKYLIIH